MGDQHDLGWGSCWAARSRTSLIHSHRRHRRDRRLMIPIVVEILRERRRGRLDPVGDRHPRRAAACGAGARLGRGSAASRSWRCRRDGAWPSQPRPGVPRAEPGGATPDRPALLPALRRVVRRASRRPWPSLERTLATLHSSGLEPPARRHGDPRPGARAHGRTLAIGSCSPRPSADGLSALDRRSGRSIPPPMNTLAERRLSGSQTRADRQARRAPAGAPCLADGRMVAILLDHECDPTRERVRALLRAHGVDVEEPRGAGRPHADAGRPDLHPPRRPTPPRHHSPPTRPSCGE